MSSKYIEKECSKTKYLDITKKFTPEILRALADRMDEDDIKSFQYKNMYLSYSVKCVESRPETQTEIDARFKKEQAKKIAQYKKIEKEKKDLIAKAEKLGLTLVESAQYE